MEASREYRPRLRRHRTEGWTIQRWLTVPRATSLPGSA
jgi:hypothetical protein